MTSSEMGQIEVILFLTDNLYTWSKISYLYYRYIRYTLIIKNMILDNVVFTYKCLVNAFLNF